MKPTGPEKVPLGESLDTSSLQGQVQTLLLTSWPDSGFSPALFSAWPLNHTKLLTVSQTCHYFLSPCLWKNCFLDQKKTFPTPIQTLSSWETPGHPSKPTSVTSSVKSSCSLAMEPSLPHSPGLTAPFTWFTVVLNTFSQSSSVDLLHLNHQRSDFEILKPRPHSMRIWLRESGVGSGIRKLSRSPRCLSCPTRCGDHWGVSLESKVFPIY